MIRAAKIDKNQPEIVQALRLHGAKVRSVAQLKKAFDLLMSMLIILNLGKRNKTSPSFHIKYLTSLCPFVIHSILLEHSVIILLK